MLYSRAVSYVVGIVVLHAAHLEYGIRVILPALC